MGRRGAPTEVASSKKDESWTRNLSAVFAVGGVISLTLVVGALVALVVWLKGQDYSGSEDGVDSIRAMLAEIKRGEMDKAYSRMSGSWRATNSLEDFEAFVTKHPALRDNRDATFPHRRASIDAGGADLEAAELTSNTGVLEVFTFRIEPEGGIRIYPIWSKMPGAHRPRPE